MQEINAFLDKQALLHPDKISIVRHIRDLFLAEPVEPVEGIKYGGLVYHLNTDLIGGIFIYKNHLSVEFSQGASFDDPSGLLEGKGKFRRHLKISAPEDITNKTLTSFIKQAISKGS